MMQDIIYRQIRVKIPLLASVKNLKVASAPIRLDVYMPKRTTVVIQDDTYAKLVQESIQRFGNARAISRVIDAMIKENSDAKKQAKKDIVRLLHSKKVAKVTQKELERDRHELSISFENRGL